MSEAGYAECENAQNLTDMGDELTYKVIGCAMKVHSKLGSGFQEVIYQRALFAEFDKVQLTFSREQEHPVYYDGIEIGTRRADFVVENKLVVEIKAVNDLLNVHLVQAKNYTVAYDYPLGLLFNFGSVRLQYKLIFNPKYNPI